ncbi:MAG: hypothetical protein B7Z37_03215, partial [Verrucomicrobia bacterium 12-59-8]
EIASSHPGPVNSEDPGFAGRNDAQLALALDRARSAQTYGDYFFALREYAASFDDGHLSFGARGATPNDHHWPGFLTANDGSGDIRVVSRADWSPVPLNAKLDGCDGKSAATIAEETLGKMWGRWNLEAQRRRFGIFLFASEESRYIPRPFECSFRIGDAEQSFTLDWRPLPLDELGERLKAGFPATTPRFEDRTLADGTRWFSIPSFNSDPQSDAGQALSRMIATIKAERTALAKAPAIVFDLRGNGGGSSDWSVQIASALWGEAVFASLPDEEIEVDWRVSAGNLAYIQRGYDERREGLSPASDHWYRTVISGMTEALARGDTLWRHTDEAGEDTAPDADNSSSPRMLPPLKGRVYFITDGSCGSACLDAVDLWRKLGMTHLGQTTSADTLYMEVRRFTLPSGITSLTFPMKVYRGRPRGSNEPVVPQHLFVGDIGDTPALEAWFAGLPGANFHFQPHASLSPAPAVWHMLELPYGGAANHLRIGQTHWLLDTGNETSFRRVLRPYLHASGVNAVAGVFLSHNDADHIGALAQVIATFDPPQLFCSTQEPGRRDRSNSPLQQLLNQPHPPLLRKLRVDERVPLSDAPRFKVEAQVLYPTLLSQSDRGDDRSMVLMVHLGRWRVLWLSDTGWHAEKILCSSSVDLRCDVLIRSQHEVDISTSAEFLLRTRPQVILCGSDARATETELPVSLVQHAKGQNTPLIDAWGAGSIDLQFQQDELHIVTQRSGQRLVLKPR